MNVRVELKLLIPGMQDCGEPAHGSAEVFWRSEFFRERLRAGTEEKIKRLFGFGPEEQIAQLRGKGEGDHEVRGVDEFAQFAIHPLPGGVSAALRAGTVIATVIGELVSMAIPAEEKLPP